ncbi:SusD/RagB family nutrient-binding outer membrane lipoprotein [Membranicola marinus]|uniref:SusD/RagB family nutrient-binding outer membrane lipoprotein n=1 Tax=Membranihabitans marinus TaxID=1227546 RepID=A0A953L5S2_9BACT|nr:SusD/RagB family nutrient-binding outer membrane lipoprotein [Membranihabitans marinus]MBY5956892.1 SusD/RagB family nutrient-binding outer membrane lipoprotein [Membranihabitans marinus]
MKYQHIYKLSFILLALFFMGCDKELTEANKNPNGIDPTEADPNLFLPSIMQGTARRYTFRGYGHFGGVMQHMQEDGWFGGYNNYQWTPENWNHWFAYLRNNEFVLEKAQNRGFTFLEGITTTMKALAFGTMTDLWGDIPYNEALKARDESEILFPTYDSQDVVYKGVLEQLNYASGLFALGDNTGSPGGADLYFQGDISKWQPFSNSLILRYAMRVSEKMPDLARQNIESVYQSGIYIKDHTEDVQRPFYNSDPWPTAESQSSTGSGFLRRKPCQTLVDVLYENQDPRGPVWFAPVHCRWVEDYTLDKPKDEFIRKNGELTNKVSLLHKEYVAEIAAGHVFTRHYNPDLLGEKLDTNVYVGVPPHMLEPSIHNENPTPGQIVQNQHVSQMAPMFAARTHDMLQSRVITATEIHFILAEAALKGWNVGNAEDHYKEGIRQSLAMWGVGEHFDSYIEQPNVKFNGTLEQIMEQKWIAGFTHALESWYDYRRTGYPVLETGRAALQSAVPVRILYGENELQFNEEKIREALERLESTPYSEAQGKNSQWAKPWLIQGTGKPW